jgi:hypothetical protein
MPKSRHNRSVSIKINEVYDQHERDLRITEIPDEGWQAVRQVILEELESITQFASNDQISKDHGLLAHSVGCLNEARRILELLETSRVDGKKIRPEESSTS